MCMLWSHAATTTEQSHTWPSRWLRELGQAGRRRARESCTGDHAQGIGSCGTSVAGLAVSALSGAATHLMQASNGDEWAHVGRTVALCI